MNEPFFFCFLRTSVNNSFEMFLLVIIKDLNVPPQTKTYYILTKSWSHGFLNFHIIFMHHDWLSPTSPFIMYSTSVIFKCSSLRVSCHSMAPSLFFILFNKYNSPSPLHIAKAWSSSQPDHGLQDAWMVWITNSNSLSSYRS